jgi:predicted dehydrogenase
MKRRVALLFLLPLLASAQPAKPFRIGIAGLTHDHVNWIMNRADDGDLEITGIAEPNKALADRYLKKFNLPASLWYPSLAEMLSKTKPEAVSAFGSTFDHLAVVQACAPRKIHVMVEKPLAVSFDHALQIMALAREHGIHVITNYETTWYGSNREVSQLAASGAIGDLRKVVIHDGHEGPKEINVSNEFFEWLTDPVMNGGGAIMDFGCYGANLLTWLMKGQRPSWVLAATQQIKPDIYPKVDDEATIIVGYPKTQGIVQASWNWPFGRKDLEVYGARGSVIADRQGSKIRLPGKSEEYVKSTALEKPYDDPFSYLAAVVRGQIKPAPSDLSALENNMLVVEILHAAKTSAATGRIVYLPAEAPKRLVPTPPAVER